MIKLIKGLINLCFKIGTNNALSVNIFVRKYQDVIIWYVCHRDAKGKEGFAIFVGAIGLIIISVDLSDYS
jgi:hypothetical protein